MDSIAIIIGCSHVNDLGLLRSLGEANIPFIFIKVGEGDEYSILKCKYLRHNELICIKTINELLPTLLTLSTKEGRKVIVCTNDVAAEYVDQFESQLSQFFITPMRGGTIGKYFNKYEQCIFARENGLIVPKSCIYTTGDDLAIYDMNYPMLIKPLESIKGSKSDIHICRNYEELKKVLLLDSVCKRYIIQEFIEKDYEINTLGVRTEQGITWGGAIKKYRHYPYPTGPGSYAKIFPVQECCVNTDAVSLILDKINYYGLFSVEFVNKDNINYFMEINFRNDGLCYVSTCAGINLPSILINNGINSKQIFRSVYMMNLYLDLKNVFLRKVGAFEWLKQVRNTQAFIDFNQKDYLPFLDYCTHLLKRYILKIFESTK